jgi:hypothetical protein
VKFIKEIKSFILQNKLFVLILILVFTLILTSLRDYGISWDERDSLDYGSQALDYYLSFGKDKSFFSHISMIEYYASRGPLIELLRQAIFSVTNKNGINFYHLILAVFALPAFYFVYKTILLITKNRLVSSLSPLFLLLMPRFYGDIFNNSKDIPFGVLVSVIIYLSVLIFKNDKNKNSLYFLILGILLGAAISLRVIIIIFIPLIFIFYFIFKLPSLKGDLKLLIQNTFIFATSFLFSLHLFLPYLHIKPIVGIFDMINSSKVYPWVGEVLFEEKFILSNSLPYYYLPKWILITTPLFIIVFALIALFFILFSKNNDKNEKYIKLITLFITLGFLVPIILTVLMKPTIYDAWRHFLFLSIPLVLMSSLGLFYLVEFFKKKKDYVKISITYLVVLIGLISTAISYKNLHPYEYVYFNSLVGGLKGAYGKYETDYWGKSMRESVEWLKINTKRNTAVKIYACAHPFQSSYYLGENMSLVGDLKDADYFICYTRNNGHLKINNDNTVHIIERQGVPLSFIKQIK